MESTERLVKLHEAASALGVSLTFVKKLRRQGTLRVVKLGRRAVRVSTREIARLCRRDQ
jgi:excisionase family DNA binding protein